MNHFKYMSSHDQSQLLCYQRRVKFEVNRPLMVEETGVPGGSPSYERSPTDCAILSSALMLYQRISGVVVEPERTWTQPVRMDT